MPFSHLPALLTSVFSALACWLDKRTAVRLPLLLAGILFARGRRTVTSWFRACGITDEFRPAYSTVCATGRKVNSLAITVLQTVRPLLTPSPRLLLAIDDTPTARYGPFVEGCGIHHNPTPGPAGEKHLYGHVWVMLAALAKHPDHGTLALPLQTQLYIRCGDVATLPPERKHSFHTKLELAADQLSWLKPWVQRHFEQFWVVVDGGYAKKPFLRAARQGGWVVVSRLRKDAALFSVPGPRQPGQRGRPRIYGALRISLAMRAGQTRGWQNVACVQYGKKVSKQVKVFQATWRPAEGVILVVLVKEQDDWLAFFCTEAKATAKEVLEAKADRGAIEQTNKDVKEVWGAGQQQVRNLDSNVGCFNLNGWMYSLVEAWAWDKEEEDLVDRSLSPWDSEARRPSHQDKRKALQREVLREEIKPLLSGRADVEEIRALGERLLALAG
jgi:hypothetical protein